MLLGWGTVAIGMVAVALLVALGLSFAAQTEGHAACGRGACEAALADDQAAAPVLSVGGVLLGAVGAGGLVVATRLRRRPPRRPRG